MGELHVACRAPAGVLDYKGMREYVETLAAGDSVRSVGRRMTEVRRHHRTVQRAGQDEPDD